MSEQVEAFLESELFIELLFWLGFLFFNFSLFAFNYVINFKEANFSPFKTILKKGKRGIFFTANPDFFRFSIDFSILVLMIRYDIFYHGISITVFYYGFLLVFNAYHFTFSKIYQVNPIIINDLKLIKNGAGILWNESKTRFVAGILLSLILVGVLCVLLEMYLTMSHSAVPNQFTHYLSSILIVVFIIALIRKGYRRRFDVYYRYIIHLLRLITHASDCLKLWRKTGSLKFDEFEKHRRLQIRLKSKPNIYLLFIESYGSVLLNHPLLEIRYKEMITSFFSVFKENRWGCKTNLSKSVSLVGPSWLAYTSVLGGYNISTSLFYEYLLYEKRLDEFDNLQKFFQGHNYASYNLNPAKFINSVNVPLERMKIFHGIDQFLLREDIPFKGTTYGFTEVPPDQYVINYSFEHYLKNLSNSFILFYLTKNSHSPFVSPKFNEDWRSLNTIDGDVVGNHFLQNPSFENYYEAIDYQLTYLQDFIIKNGREDDVFLLIGDHQPHVLCNREDGTDTIVHIISKNSKFQSEFEAYGFRDSIENLDSPVKHEALYSIFMRSFIKTFGEDNQPLPDYEPDGLQI